jgi:hypothetical protein
MEIWEQVADHDWSSPELKNPEKHAQHMTYRLAVPGGWLYRYGDCAGGALCFVAGPPAAR